MGQDVEEGENASGAGASLDVRWDSILAVGTRQQGKATKKGLLLAGVKQASLLGRELEATPEPSQMAAKSALLGRNISLPTANTASSVAEGSESRGDLFAQVRDTSTTAMRACRNPCLPSTAQIPSHCFQINFIEGFATV